MLAVLPELDVQLAIAFALGKLRALVAPAPIAPAEFKTLIDIYGPFALVSAGFRTAPTRWWSR